MIRCSFCGKNQASVLGLIASPHEGENRVHICDECVCVCVDLLLDKGVLAFEGGITQAAEKGSGLILPGTANASATEAAPSAGGKEE
jgi:hypothetical protein